MTALDHRILIPSPPQAVWAYLSDLANLPEWQVGCEYVTYLSQKRQGIGTRWRQRATNRQEHVYEVVSWYDTLGFEYTLIDGAPFKTAQGRVRLQEIPEGTIVQWSFNYELAGGVFGGLRNALTTERRQDKLMVDSLKTLWKQSRRLGSLENYVPRTLMRDGLQDPEARATYTGKRVTTQTNPVIPSVADTPVAPRITEPPISDEDTRPRPSVVDADVLPSHATPPPATTDEQRATQEHERFAPPASPRPPDTPPALATPPPPDTPPALATPPPTNDDRPALADFTPPAPTTGDNLTPQIPLERDTAEVSIWEVFGIPSPTDTQRMRAIQVAEEAEAEYAAEAAATQAPSEAKAETTLTATGGRDGVRSRLRRRTVRVRRPGG